jgi:host factor-I protein
LTSRAAAQNFAAAVNLRGWAESGERAEGSLNGPFAVTILRRSAMDTKPAQNIQDSFLNTARKERTNVTIYLLSGVKLTGRIRSFDKYSVVLDTNNQEQLIFKHAISTVAMGRSAHVHSDKTPVMSAGSESGSASVATNSASEA